MKRFVFFCITLLTFESCSVGNDSNNFERDFIPIENVVVPDSFILGETYTIDVIYDRLSTCHFFDTFYYVENGNELTVVIINLVSNNADCEPLEDEPIEVSFDFKAVYNQTYVFKFWQGLNEAGEDIYLTYVIPVVD